MAKITEIKGNIFDSSCDVLVNTVNCKGFMGKGIALEFKYRYPEMFQDYKKKCDKGLIKIGYLDLWEKSTPKILNFPTKYDWKYPSKMEYISDGLKFFIENYKKWNIRSIAFPWLGSSQGGLNWIEVKELMFKMLENVDLTIEIYEFDINAADKLFTCLEHKLKRKLLKEYILIGLKQKQAKKLKEIIDSKKIKNLTQLQNIKGFGEKSLKSIYSFAKNGKIIVQKSII